MYEVKRYWTRLTPTFALTIFKTQNPFVNTADVRIKTHGSES